MDKRILVLWCGILSSLCFMAMPAMAAQHIEAEEGRALKIISSTKSYNHLSIAGDRVKSLKGGLAHQVILPVKQLGDGSLLFYINSPEPVQVFVHTEKQKTYTLKLFPSDEEGDTIVLQPKEDALKQQNNSLNNHTNSVTTLIKALYQELPALGYSKQPLTTTDWDFKGLTITPEYKLDGRKLTGEVYLVKNPTDETAYLYEAKFYQEGVVAIAFGANTLPPQGYARLFLIKAKRGSV